MSWLVKRLILDSSIIRSNQDFESDDHMSLLLLEAKIKDLHKKGVLSNKEINLIVAISNYRNYSLAAKYLNINRNTVMMRFNEITNRIAYYLGGYYTDLGYIEYMIDKYNLTQEQQDKLVRLIFKN